MRFAVGNIEDAFRKQNAVRPGKLAAKGTGFGPIAALSCSEHSRDDAGLNVDLANRVILRVRKIEGSPFVVSQTFGSAKRRTQRRSVVSCITLRAGARDSMKRLRLCVDPHDRIAFT